MRWLLGFERTLARVSGNDVRSRSLSRGLLAPGAAFSFTAAASPYTGTPIALPGTFQAENFDRGGEGVGYHDLSPGNTGDQYHTESVDIDRCGGTYAPNSIIHDRLVRGASPLALALGPLEGALELVNGVLTPVQ